MWTLKQNKTKNQTHRYTEQIGGYQRWKVRGEMGEGRYKHPVLK